MAERFSEYKKNIRLRKICCGDSFSHAPLALSQGSPMNFKKRRLGRTSCFVTELGMGTAPLGGLYTPVSEEVALETLEAAWASGVRLFDTAPLYGNGLSERLLGSFLKFKPREEYVLATKVGRRLRAPTLQAGEGMPPVFDFSYDGVMRAFEESLLRLGAERVDILHIHDPDNHYRDALAGAYKALDNLRSQGAIKAVGAGMNQSEMLVRFARDGVFDCFLLAGRYTLLDQGALAEFLPLWEERGISVIAAGVYNSGILADPRANAKFDYQDADQSLINRAMQFAAAHPAVATTLTGARSPTEIEENVAAYSLAISPVVWEDLLAEGLIASSVPVPTKSMARSN
jgi:D-threo-aldose 1-dehydrogenase